MPTDIKTLCAELSERWPEWSQRLAVTEFSEIEGLGTAANDGRRVYYSDRLMRYLTPEQQLFTLAQQVAHIQLDHFARGRGKNPGLWRRASDAVVNALLKEDGFSLPENAPLPPSDRSYSAEELYDLLLEANGEGESEAPQIIQGQPVEKDSSHQAGGASEAHTREIEDPGIATAVAGLAELLEPSLQTDFDWFPAASIRSGVLGHEFRAYPVACTEILLDTSASVDAELLRAFVRGVKGLMQQDAVIRVGCFDTRFYGFQDINSEQDIQTLRLDGAGGTDFHAAIGAFTGDAENRIIFTDGYAEMPEERCDAIWVVYGTAVIHPKGGRVIYVRPTEEKEKHEIDFLIT